jgi:hypothetical protein
LTADRRRIILEALAAGATKKNAAASAGVTYRTFNSWCHSDIHFLHACEDVMCKRTFLFLREKRRTPRGERTPEKG